MERRFRIRLEELLDDAEVRPSVLKGVLPRLESFLEPFVAALQTPEQRTNAQHYVQGLLSDLQSKDVESIAYLHDRERQGLQKFIGQTEWDHRPLLTELARQVGWRWANLTVCWSSIPRLSSRRGPSRSASNGSGAVGSARS